MLSVFAASCGRADAALDHVQIDTLPSGRVQVVNDGVGQWTPETAWTLVEDLRLGSMEQAGPELFSQVASIVTDSVGRLFILDSQTQEVRVFTSAGEHSQTFGGLGEGPGELAGASGLSWAPDGRLWVWGGNSRRYDVLEPSGQHMARYTRTLSGIVTPWSGGFTSDGRYVDFGVAREVTGREQVGTSLVTYTNGRTTVSPSAFTAPDRTEPLPVFEFWAEVTERGQLKRPALKSLALHVAEDGIWFAHPDTFKIFKRTFDGDTLLSFSLPSQPKPVLATEIDSLIASAARAGRVITRDEFYTHYELINRIVTDHAGHVYVFPEEDGVPAGSVVDVFQDSGIYLGRMRFPETILVERPVPHITRDHIYAVPQHEMDVPYVIRLRIVRP